MSEVIQKSDKGFVPTILLCCFLGGLGVHRFYVGKVGTGILMLITFGGFGIWALIDFVMIVTGSFRDKQGFPVRS
jgi:TM2 domain-containing membrane protein YozV